MSERVEKEKGRLFYKARIRTLREPSSRFRRDEDRDRIKRKLNVNGAGITQRTGINFEFAFVDQDGLDILVYMPSNGGAGRAVWSTIARELFRDVPEDRYSIESEEPLPQAFDPSNKVLPSEVLAQLDRYRVFGSPEVIAERLEELEDDRGRLRKELKDAADSNEGLREALAKAVREVRRAPALEELLVYHVRANGSAGYNTLNHRYSKLFPQGIKQETLEAIEFDESRFVLDERARKLMEEIRVTYEKNLDSLVAEVKSLEIPFEKTQYYLDNTAEYIGSKALVESEKSEAEPLLGKAGEKIKEYENQKKLHDEHKAGAAELVKHLTSRREKYRATQAMTEKKPLNGVVHVCIYNDPRDRTKWSFALPTEGRNDSSDLSKRLFGYITKGIEGATGYKDLRVLNIMGSSVVEINGVRGDINSIVANIGRIIGESCLGKLGIEVRPYFMGGHYGE